MSRWILFFLGRDGVHLCNEFGNFLHVSTEAPRTVHHYPAPNKILCFDLFSKFVLFRSTIWLFFFQWRIRNFLVRRECRVAALIQRQEIRDFLGHLSSIWGGGARAKEMMMLHCDIFKMFKKVDSIRRSLQRRSSRFGTDKLVWIWLKGCADPELNIRSSLMTLIKALENPSPVRAPYQTLPNTCYVQLGRRTVCRFTAP